MLTGIHFLLTYKCIFECDHCFVYSSPRAEGTFTIEQIRKVLDEAKKIETIQWIYFEGGEPFLYYPLMLEGIKMASRQGYKTGVVTNAYFANSFTDSVKWLLPLNELGVNDLSISGDSYHNDGTINSKAKIAFDAAEKMSMHANMISICEPEIKSENIARKKGEPVVGGDVMFRGRAADKLTSGLPGVYWKEFSECPYEDLVNPSRVHIDAFGYVQICQGISIGNMWETPFSDIILKYNSVTHPICSKLIEGGPGKLAEHYNKSHEETYIDACHLCFETRKKLIDKFPEYLAPKQVYGL